ncbi:ankyrin repeat domain-containing protein [Paraburkholderia sp. BL9I2N2]|nr:ankyrin repeat domain-containing protein [Paraburkholderia sp. BL9I2N2]
MAICYDFPDTQSRSIDGMTPLMLAALHAEDHIAAALLDEGSTPLRAR